jgi:Zn-dependent protease
MGWEDRDYNRDGSDGRGHSSWMDSAIAFFQLEIPAGTYFGITVRVHIWFVIYILMTMLQAAVSGDVFWTLRWLAMLFGSVLLHEFGHCFGCRAVGGTADKVLLWPLGGLATCSPPHRPWPSFVTTACGPLVNLVIAAVCYSVLRNVVGSSDQFSANPWSFWSLDPYLGWHGLVRDLYVVNACLFLFNMLMLCLPFDGGRIVHEILWAWRGWSKSMYYACNFGMIYAIFVCLFGIVTGRMLLFFIAVMGLLYCFQTLQQLRIEERERGYEYGGDDLWQIDTIKRKKPGMYARWRTKRAEAKLEQARRQEAEAEAEVDRILAKVKAQGLHSLTDREKNTLRRDTERRNRVG